MNEKERAQVGVVVAILMVSLFVAVIVLIQVYYVPNWMKDKEADHMDTVANQFSNIKFSIDLQAMAQMDVPITNSITLGSKELPYFVSARSFGSLNVLSSNSSSFSISVTSQSGKEERLYQPSPFNPGTIDYISSISTFEIVISVLHDGDTFNVSINGNKNLEVDVFNDTGSFRITLKTINNTQILFNQTIASGISSQEEFRVNLLNPDYKFATDVLPYVSTPYNISVNGSSNGDFEIKCYKYDNAVIGPSYDLGTISYQSENAYFVDQTYVYEGGAVVLGQPGSGEAIISPPFFDVKNLTTKYVINISAINIEGMAGKTSASGYGTYSIRINYSSYREYKALAKNVTIRINTNYPVAWERYLNNTMNSSKINFTIDVNESNNYISLVIEGPQQGSAYDVEFCIRITKIYAQVGPGWVS